MMMSPKKLMKLMAKIKWQIRDQGGDARRKTICLTDLDLEANIYGTCVNSSGRRVCHKAGHFVIYTTDQKRFVIPLVYLDNNIFREMLKMSEDEFGLPRDGPIKLPCDEVFMKYIVKMIQRGVTEDIERALLMSMAATTRCSLSSFHQGQTHTTGSNQLLVCGYARIIN